MITRRRFCNQSAMTPTNTGFSGSRNRSTTIRIMLLCCWSYTLAIVMQSGNNGIGKVLAYTASIPANLIHQQNHYHHHPYISGRREVLFQSGQHNSYDTSLHMSSSSSYKPPVQNSVSKLRSSRFSSTSPGGSGSTGTPSDGRPTTGTSSRRGASSSSAGIIGGSNVPITTPPSFEDRMRGLLGRQEVEERSHRRQTRRQQQLTGQDSVTPSSSTLSPSGTHHNHHQNHHHLPSNLYVVDNLQDYKSIVGDEQSRLVCVGFFASWCKACKAALPLFYRMATQFPSVTFVHVPVNAHNTNLHQGLGVQRLPSGHIYHPTVGLVEEDIKVTRKTMGSFGTILQSYVQGSCDLLGVGNTMDPRNPLLLLSGEGGRDGDNDDDDDDVVGTTILSSTSSSGLRTTSATMRPPTSHRP